MKIENTTTGITLTWEYAIKNNTTTKKDVEYVSHEASFPTTLSEYLQVDYIYIYPHEGKILIATEEPPYPSVRQKLFKKNKEYPQRTISLSKKIFHLTGYTPGVLVYKYHVDLQDPLTRRRGLLELCVDLK